MGGGGGGGGGRGCNVKSVALIQSNFNGSNCFGTMKISSRQG